MGPRGGAHWRSRLLALGVATLAGLALLSLVAAWTSRRGPAPSVLVVDQTDAVDALLAARERALDGATAALRAPLDEEVARRFHPALARGKQVYDPLAYALPRPHMRFERIWPEHAAGGWTSRTNGLGLHEEHEVLPVRPDLRVLVTGDSHTAGVCAPRETFSHVLEELLHDADPMAVVETLNAGAGGYNAYNYLGVMERHAELRPHVFVVVVYGGNDFSGVARMQRYFAGRGRMRHDVVPAARLAALGRDSAGLVPQEISQVAYFLNNPEDERRVVTTLADLGRAMRAHANLQDAELLLVYLPPPSSGQPRHSLAACRRLVGELGASDPALELSDRIADAWLDAARADAIPTLDLRPVLRGERERTYWRTDHHLNPLGHRRVAEALLPAVQALVD